MTTPYRPRTPEEKFLIEAFLTACCIRPASAFPISPGEGYTARIISQRAHPELNERGEMQATMVLIPVGEEIPNLMQWETIPLHFWIERETPFPHGRVQRTAHNPHELDLFASLPGRQMVIWWSINAHPWVPSAPLACRWQENSPWTFIHPPKKERETAQ